MLANYYHYPKLRWGYIYKVKLATLVEGGPKATFSIATTPRCRVGCYSIPWIAPLCYILTFWPGQKCHSEVMHRKEVTHSNDSYERKLCGRKLADEMGRAKKFPWYTHRLMHRKRVTYELHDSYFCLMTIKHSISKIKWTSNDYITQLSSTKQ